MINRILILLVFIVFFSKTSYAYLDPGTGSAIMSLIIGFFVAIGVLIKTFWYKIKSLFSSNSNKK